MVLAQISSKFGKNVVARGKTAGQRITLLVRNQPIERVLDLIVNQKPNWLWYANPDQPGTYEIWDQESFRTEILPKQVRQKVYVPREITAEEAFKAIQGVLTPNIGAASFDPRSNKVIVTDLPYVLELIQRLIEQIDVKFMTRVFYIAHADVSAISEKLANLKSPAAPAPEVDTRTHQIIVRDRLEIIRQMELLVETLDIGPEMRVYDLNNLEFEGAGRQDLEDAIQAVITADAFWKVNVQSGKLMVEDVPEVHEKIEKILAAFDQPAKQVLVQAEVIETDFSESFNYSIDYNLSRDLFSSVVDNLVAKQTSTNASGVPTGSGTVDNQTLGFIDFRKEFPVVSAGSSGVNAQYLSKHAFITLKAAMSDSRSRVLQQPRALVKNQKEVRFDVGQKVPYYSAGYSTYNYNNTNNGSYTAQPNLNFIQTGLDLNIRPTINNNGLVEMEVEMRNNSATFKDLTFAGQTNTAPLINTQELESTLIIPSGETRVVGGLVSETKSESRSGIPGLYRIPVLGPLLFGSYSKPGDARKNLLLFLTPTIVLEKPKDLLRYKGKVIVDEAAADVYTTPSATLSDVQCEPLPLALPELAPAEPTPAGRLRAEPPELSVRKPRASEEEKTVKSAEASEEEETVNEEPSAQPNGLTELKKVHIAEPSPGAATAPGMVPRAAGPSGALTGTASAPSGAVRAGTATAPGRPGAAVGAPPTTSGMPGSPAAPSGTPMTYTAPTQTPYVQMTPVVTPVPSNPAPPPETRY